MKRGPLTIRLVALIGVGLLFAACAETQFIVHSAKRIIPQAPKADGKYKVGNPYQIKGKWYYPAVNYEFDQTGIGSWYGKKFHGRQTANGEIFDMNEVTAAHRTLPMPSIVQVTNLENGRSMRLTVNDRGPYAHNRIIDLSRRSAQLLGYERQGTARVRVKILGEESRILAARLRGDAQLASIGTPITVDRLPKPKVSSQALPPPGADPAAAPPPPVEEDKQQTAALEANPTQAEEPKVTQGPVINTGIYIQAGAFTQYDNANRVQAILSTIGPVKISSVLSKGKDFFRVRLGPVVSVTEADGFLEQVIKAGYANARIIIE